MQDKRGFGGRPPGGGGVKRAPPMTPERAARMRRVEELQHQGIPLELARSVASGQITVNDAVQRLQRMDEVQRLIKKYEIDAALANQVAMGHVKIEDVLARRRIAEMLATHKARTVFESPGVWTLGLHGQASRQVTFTGHTAYEFTVADDATPVHKTTVKFAFLTDDYKRVRKSLDYDKDRRVKVDPVLRPQDRYACSDRLLGEWWANAAAVSLTTVEGEVFSGEIGWVSRFEVGLKLRAGADAVVFRHALADARRE